MSKSNHELEAMRIIAEAQKKEKGSSGFMALFGGGPNYEEASEMYCNAANLMLMAKQYNTGGELYEKAAECSIKANQGYDAASTYVKAANAYKKSNPDRGIQCLKRAVEYYATQGRFSMAAKIQKEIAEALEKNKDTMAEAIEAYQSAADYFEGEGSTSQANQCYLKIAEYCANVGNYTKAVELFEKAAYEALENKLLQYGAKDLFLKAGLCQLCVDVVLARRSLDNYLSRDHRFSAQREADFLEKLISAVEKLDVQAFSNACVEWDSISRLDNWKQDVLLFIRRSIESQGDEVDEDDLV